METNIHITIVFDFMCPRSFIGFRCVELAMKKIRDLYVNKAINFFFRLMPLEFDAPGTYPAEGIPWSQICAARGRDTEADVSRIFSLGSAVGIKFDMERKLVHTEAVNAALMAAQRSYRGFEFAVAVLRHHFEGLRDPNDPRLLKEILERLRVPEVSIAEALTPSLARRSQHEEFRQMGLRLGRASVPRFRVTCGEGGEDLCPSSERIGTGSATAEGPVVPEYFELAFEACVAKSRAAAHSPTSTIPFADEAHLPAEVREAVAQLGRNLSRATNPDGDAVEVDGELEGDLSAVAVAGDQATDAAAASGTDACESKVSVISSVTPAAPELDSMD
eukprot:TRINITY_DN39750_c0_g1_i1.p1 TRINITY_DN39750_c0_g1~~TRINITY_DN39750_c0_g1_i1.p1  ORF type:complete len:333 (-),score=58.07 TRINITY_DN39750_c0_g1_i1:46-1044(-)